MKTTIPSQLITEKHLITTITATKMSTNFVYFRVLSQKEKKKNYFAKKQLDFLGSITNLCPFI